jgi:dipeptidyl aminopeptidase/acylaminoacyl peptidase
VPSFILARLGTFNRVVLNQNSIQNHFLMKTLSTVLTAFCFISCFGQSTANEEARLKQILTDPSAAEISEVLTGLRQMDLSAKNIVVHDSIDLPNTNRLYVISHQVEGRRHYGAIITPVRTKQDRLPVVIFATGGDGMSTAFDITQDFNHAAAQFPSFLGRDLDSTTIVVIPSFRGQQLIIGQRKFQSDGDVGDAFDGATTDALALLNVALKQFKHADKNQIAIYGGSRGGTVALLAAARDKRIKKVIAVAAPTDMKQLYLLYPEQFKLLFFRDLLANKITEQQARKKFIACSPIYFVNELPALQLHHDNNDPFVPVSFAKQLEKSIGDKGKRVEAFYYNEGIHGFWSDAVFWKRVQKFVR